MAVQLQGQHSFPASREVVWRAITDPDILARTLPGCEELTRAGENRFEGTLNIKVGPVSGQFRGGVSLSEVRPLEGYRLEIKGDGAAGFMEGTGTVDLEDAPGGTLLRYDVQAEVGGRIAGVGGRLLDSSAKVVTRQALEGLERQVAALAAAVAAAPAAAVETVVAPVVEAPSQSALAADFAKGLASELVPRENRPLILLISLLVLLGLAALAVRACGS